MHIPQRPLSLFFPALLTMILLLSGCTPRAYLIVDYQLPPASRQLEGRQIRLEINDAREDTQVLGPAAALEFEGFQDRYSLAWVTLDESRILTGEYDLKSLLHETFLKRLETMGVHVVFDNAAPVLNIELHELKVDLKGRNWVVQASYEAILSRDLQEIAREAVSGNAQRTKVIGRKDADTALSDLFSDIINRLNILKLFQQAQLV